MISTTPKEELIKRINEWLDNMNLCRKSQYKRGVIDGLRIAKKLVNDVLLQEKTK